MKKWIKIHFQRRDRVYEDPQIQRGENVKGRKSMSRKNQVVSKVVGPFVSGHRDRVRDTERQAETVWVSCRLLSCLVRRWVWYSVRSSDPPMTDFLFLKKNARVLVGPSVRSSVCNFYVSSIKKVCLTPVTYRAVVAVPISHPATQYWDRLVFH